MKEWILFILGTLAYLMIRYSNRKNKTAAFSLLFWIKDNWAEIGLALIMDVIAMIILMDASTSVDVTNWLNQLPIGIVLSGKLFLSAGCGLGLGKGAYEFIKRLKGKKE